MAGSETSAKGAILKAIAAKADQATIEEIGTLATAYQQVVHGPQGGSMAYDYNNETTYNQNIDQTTHTHQHLEGSRNGVGF